MPRTKVPKKKVQKLNAFADLHLPIFENNISILRSNIESKIDIFLRDIQAQLIKTKLTIPQTLLSKTFQELTKQPLNWSGDSTNISVQVLETTKALTVKKEQVKRSLSCGDDEGYLTTESTKSTSGRQSRSKSRLQNTSHKPARSLSSQKRTTSKIDKMKTPANKGVPINSYGTVTPKVKPNTPQVLLRRPKNGEVALSLQGSPLMTGTVVSDQVANINIPLEDGRLLSIQPKRGLRISQIPQLDTETRRQLETLRDNLNKVCALSCKR